MKSKIKQLKKLFQEDTNKNNSSIIPKQYVDYCEGDDMPAGLFQKKTNKSRFYFTKFPDLQNPSRCINALDGGIRTKFSSKSFQITYNSIQQKIFERLYGTVSSLDNKWFQLNDDFIRQLPVEDKLALVAMTNKSQQHIQAYLKGENNKLFKQRIRKWRQDIHGYLPIFFPLYHKYKTHLKTKTKKEAYQYMIEKICPLLTDQEIDECIVELVKKIRHIFSICPKTTKRMTLWRGIRSVPGLSYSGFTSFSLDPSHTLVYTGNDCCLQKLTILPGTPLLFIGGLSSFTNELECVLPDNLKLYEISKKIESIPTVMKMKQKCPDTKNMKRILIQHAVVL